jgi:hypothetical protein
MTVGRFNEIIEPITLGNMRELGVRSLDVSCWNCHHQVVLSADRGRMMSRCRRSDRARSARSAALSAPTPGTVSHRGNAGLGHDVRSHLTSKIMSVYQ